jgi:acyl-CoA thioesterase
LADLALAAIMNSRGLLTFSLQSSIAFLHSAKVGDTLVAEAEETCNHHKIHYAEVKIRNRHGELVSAFTGVAYRKHQEL